MCGILLLATFLNYMDRQALAVTVPELKKTYNLHEERNGWLEGSFGLAFAFGSLVFGWLADRYGPRVLYPVVLSGWSLAGIATGFAGEPWVARLLEVPGDEQGAGPFRWLMIWRTILGVCEAGHWPCALITARHVLSAADRPLGNGLLQSGASFGAILIPLYVQLVEHLGGGWQFVFWSVGIGGLLWVPLWLGFIRRGDLASAHGPTDEKTHSAPGSVDSGEFVRRLIVLGVIVSCLTVSWQFLRAWLPLFLQDFHGYSPLETRLAVAGYFITADVGCILVGVLVKLLVRRGSGVHTARVFCFAGFAALTAMAAVVPFLGSGPVMVGGLMVAGAGVLGLHPLYYALSQELPAKRMGVLSGGLAAIGWVISAVNQILIGAHIKETKSYDVGLVIAGLVPLVGLLALAILWKPGQDKAGAVSS